MADFKRRTLLLNTGKQVKLFGSSFAISKSLEIGEGYAPNIFSCSTEQPTEKKSIAIINPHHLTTEEMMELADYNMQLWMGLKENIRKYGIDSIKVFNRDAGH